MPLLTSSYNVGMSLVNRSHERNFRVRGHNLEQSIRYSKSLSAKPSLTNFYACVVNCACFKFFELFVKA
jgi:hypothetical protein